MEIGHIDKNFQIVATAEDGTAFYDADRAPFRVYGLMREEDAYCRLPRAVAQATSEGVGELMWSASGGRVRFVTDSETVSIRVSMFRVLKVPHMALTGSAGFDLYVDEGEGDRYTGTFMPPFEMTDGYSSTFRMSGARRRVVTINFPLYSGVSRLLIGLKEGALLEKAPDYRVETPVVCYGSSITQGACASRPGTCYQSIVARLVGCNFVNLGFSGNARAEESIAAYIATLSMSAFVMDYDHNADTVEFLRATHQKMFQTVRAKQPTLPILLMTRPTAHLTADEKARVAVIRRTYETAKAAGDDHVYLLEGAAMLDASVAETWTVDGCHPNDNGFTGMGYSVATILKTLL